MSEIDEMETSPETKAEPKKPKPYKRRRPVETVTFEVPLNDLETGDLMAVSVTARHLSEFEFEALEDFTIGLAEDRADGSGDGRLQRCRAKLAQIVLRIDDVDPDDLVGTGPLDNPKAIAAYLAHPDNASLCWWMFRLYVTAVMPAPWLFRSFPGGGEGARRDAEGGMGADGVGGARVSGVPPGRAAAS